MAAVTVAQVRQRVAARLAGLADWREAPVPYELFGVSAVPDAIPASIAHRCFAVGIVGHENTRVLNGRASEGAYAEADVRVRFLYRVPPKSQVGAEDGAHDAAHEVIKRLMAQDSEWPRDIKVLWLGTTPGMASSGEWMSFELRFMVQHLYALS